MALIVCSCGKKNIWNDVNKSGFSAEVLENAKKGKYDLNVMSEDGYTILTKYICDMDYSTFSILCKAGIDIDQKDERGNYPILVFMEKYNGSSDSEKIIQDLIANVKDINVENAQEKRVLSYEASYPYIYEIFKRGFDTSYVDYRNSTWPVLTEYNRNKPQSEFFKLLESPDFKMCEGESWLSVQENDLQKSYSRIKSFFENKKKAEYFKPENKKEDTWGEQKKRLPILPTLISSMDDEDNKNNVHYLMADTKFPDGSEYKIGTKVEILSYKELSGPLDPEVVDGICALNYLVKIGDMQTYLNGRYISMFESFADIDDDGTEEILLSNYAYNDRTLYEDDKIKSCYYRWVYDDSDTFIACAVYINDGIPQSLSNYQDVNMYPGNLGFVKGSQSGSCPVISGVCHSGPFSTEHEIAFICGNEIIPVKKITILEPDEPNDFTSRFYDYEVYNKSSAIYVYKKEFDEDSHECITYVYPYAFKFPFVISEGKRYAEVE